MSEDSKEDKFVLIYMAMIYIGLYMFLYGLVKERATKVSTKIVAWISTWMILILGTMLIYDRSSDPKPVTYVESVVVKAAVANVRSGPFIGDNVVGKAKRGDKLDYLWKAGVWYNISYGDEFAYIHRSVVDKNYITVPGQYRWPSLPIVFIIFLATYIAALVSAFRQDHYWYRGLSDA